MNTIQEFIGVLFLARDFAHKAHLNSMSYAEHMALDSFYSDIVDLADDIAEMWQGRNQQLIGEIALLTIPRGDALSTLKTYLEVIEGGRDTVFGDDSAIQNKVDEVVGLFLKTIYKLTFLK